MKVKLFENWSEEGRIYTGSEVNKHIKDITPFEDNLPHFFMKKISKRKFEIKEISLKDLLKTDTDFKEYYDNSKNSLRYDDHTEDDEDNPHRDNLDYEIVVVDGEILDGYNRASFLLRNGEKNIKAYVALTLKTKKTFELLSFDTTMRLSCAGLARIIIDGKYLFILNKNSVKVGNPTYGPLGGALEFSEAARPFLESIEANFEKGMDLRLMIPTDNLEEYLDWFYSRKDREITTLREVFEELVLEEELVQMDPDTMLETYVKTYTEDKYSNREGKQGVKTKAVYEIYDVKLDESVEEQILEYIKTTLDKKVILVSKEDVLSDPRLGSHCKYIL